jgi:phosphotriesterase-related protein
MASVATATGPVDEAKLGFTLSHEHVIVGSAGVREAYPFLFDMPRTRQRVIEELTEAKAGGVDTLIDVTTMDLSRDVDFVADVSRASGMQVVVASGLWRDIPRFFWGASADFIARVFIREIEEGIGANRVRPGVIKVANDEEGVTEQAELVLRAAARACKATNVPITTHQYAPGEVGRRQVEIFLDEGTPMDRVCIGHSADTADVAYLEGLLREGVYLSMDRYPSGMTIKVDWRQRNATVKALIERGWVDRLMVGHDYAPAPCLAGRDGPEPDKPTRYLFLSKAALPALVADGVDEAAIRKLTVDNPRRFLTGGA